MQILNNTRGSAAIIITLVLAAVLVGGGITYGVAATQGGPLADRIAALGIPIKTDTDRVFEAFAKTGEQERVNVDIEATAVGTSTRTNPLTGEEETEDVDAVFSLHHEGLPITAEDGPSQGTFSVRGTTDGTPITAGLEYRMTGERGYFRVSPDTDLGEELPVEIASALSGWYFVDFAMLEEQFGGRVQEVEQGCTDPEAFQAHFQSKDPRDLGVRVSRVGSEEVGGEAATRFLATFDGDKMLTELAQALALAGCPGVDGINDLRRQKEVRLDRATFLVGKDTGLLRGIDASPTLVESGEDLDVSISMRMPAYNRTPQVEAPAEAKDLMEAVFGFMFGMMGGMQGTLPEGSEIPEGMFDTPQGMEGLDPSQIEQMEEMMQ